MGLLWWLQGRLEAAGDSRQSTTNLIRKKQGATCREGMQVYDGRDEIAKEKDCCNQCVELLCVTISAS